MSDSTRIVETMVSTAEMMTMYEMTDRRVTRIGDEPSPVRADSRSCPTKATRVTYGFLGKRKMKEIKRNQSKKNEKRERKVSVSKLKTFYKGLFYYHTNRFEGISKPIKQNLR